LKKTDRLKSNQRFKIGLEFGARNPFKNRFNFKKTRFNRVKNRFLTRLKTDPNWLYRVEFSLEKKKFIMFEKKRFRKNWFGWFFL